MKTIENRDGWTDERTATAVKYWTEGHTAQQIADKLGGLTRSAVIGKLFRLGLGRGRPTATPAQRKQRKSVAKFNFAGKATKAKTEPKPADPYVYRETIVTPENQRISFEALVDGRCKYAHGDTPPYSFCGAKVVPTTSWCPAHFQAVFGTPARTEVFQEPSKNPGPENMGKSHILEGAA